MAQIEITQAIDAPLPLIWHYLSTADGLSTWHADQVRGSLTLGHFDVSWPNLHASMTLHVEDYEPLQSLELRAGPNHVTFRLSHGGVHLTHEGLEDEDDLAGFASSWSLSLGLLAHAIERQTHRSRKVTWLFAQAPTSPSLAHYYFSTAQGLRSWLGQSPSDIGEPGSPLRLQLSSQIHLQGQVLTHYPDRDVSFTWKELGNAVLVLRTFPAADNLRTLALSLSTYSRDPSPEIIAALQTSLLRLSTQLKGKGLS